MKIKISEILIAGAIIFALIVFYIQIGAHP